MSVHLPERVTVMIFSRNMQGHFISGLPLKPGQVAAPISGFLLGEPVLEQIRGGFFSGLFILLAALFDFFGAGFGSWGLFLLPGQLIAGNARTVAKNSVPARNRSVQS